ncbi:MAG: NADH-quinone oxidoreductase, subunit [Fibrobacteria bacterium]|jgi:NADH-quinone oxidoreductase subunit F|nr:NADH-quinone oxidoreductase, subunit [Fibrobacteria bacterium]
MAETTPPAAPPAPPASEAPKPKPVVPFSPVILKHIHEPNAHTLEHYLARGGYETARKHVGETDPASLVAIVKDSGLRGRGGAGFPTGMKWGFLAKGTGKPAYLAVNGDESEPGTFKDRHILEKDPHQLLEGVILTCWAIQSNHAFIYLRGEFILGYQRLEAAVKEARAKGFIGEKSFGKDFPLKVTVVRGAGAYICGEETGMLSSIEGGRGYPKIKPPFPAVSGLFKCPTIVNNVETIANVTHIVKNGADWHKQWGTEKSPGYKIFCLAGAVKKPGVYEVPLGITMREFIDVYGGGMVEGRTLKAVIPGGLSAPLLTPEMVDKCTLDYESLAGLGSMLGSGGITVLHDGVDMMSAIYNTMRFYHHESCGQCTPCREGTGWLEKLAHKHHAGHAHAGDTDLLADVAKNMRGRTICVLADAAAMPMQSYLQLFRPEFDKRVAAPEYVEKGRTARDEITPAAKRESVTHGAPGVLDVGMGMDRV